MKLAELLSKRQEIQQTIEDLTKRAENAVRIQEGDDAPESVLVLLSEIDANYMVLESIVTQIDAINAATGMVTDLINRRMTQSRHAALNRILTRATRGDYRYNRNEIKEIVTVDVPTLRAYVERDAKALREVDLQIQAQNWTIEVPED